MNKTPPRTDPRAYREWLDRLEQAWEAGLIPDPQAVAVIVLNDRGEVLLQLRDDDPRIAFAGSWTLPGGVVEFPETPEQAAKRELAEETGLQLSLSHWKVYKRKPEDRRFMIEQHVFFATTEQGTDEMTVGEGQALRFFGRDALPVLSIAFDFGKLLGEFFATLKPGG